MKAHCSIRPHTGPLALPAKMPRKCPDCRAVVPTDTCMATQHARVTCSSAVLYHDMRRFALPCSRSRSTPPLVTSSWSSSASRQAGAASLTHPLAHSLSLSLSLCHWASRPKGLHLEPKPRISTKEQHTITVCGAHAEHACMGAHCSSCLAWPACATPRRDAGRRAGVTAATKQAWMHPAAELS